MIKNTDGNKIKLAVIPTDPIEAYKQKGTSSWLEDYYNPGRFAGEVYALSPFEDREHFEFGMHIIPTRPEQLRHRIKTLNIDLVRAYGGYTACEMACDNKIAGVPVVVSVHDTDPNILFDSIKKADVVYCVSNTVRNLVLSKFGDPSRAWLLSNRVNFNVMKPSGREELAPLKVSHPFKYNILHVGRKTRQKNLDTLLLALKELGDDYGLIAIGKNDSCAHQGLAERYGVQKRCTFIESIPNEQLPLYYSFADCMCTPSRWEGFGLAFIEALACETVVVTSDIAPMNEFISDEHNGILVKEYEQSTPLAAAIVKACTDRDLRKKIKSNARPSVYKFEKNQIDSLESSYYSKVLAMNAAGMFKRRIFERIKNRLGF